MSSHSSKSPDEFEAWLLHHPKWRGYADLIMERYSQCDGWCELCHENRIDVVDHCHSSGLFRGLLCGRCNSGLGFFRDRTRLLAAAIVYLEDYGSHDYNEEAKLEDNLGVLQDWMHDWDVTRGEVTP